MKYELNRLHGLALLGFLGLSFNQWNISSLVEARQQMIATATSYKATVSTLTFSYKECYAIFSSIPDPAFILREEHLRRCRACLDICR